MPAAAAGLPATPEEAIARLVALNNGHGLQSPEGEALLSGELDRLASPGTGRLPGSDRVVAIGADKAVARIAAADGRPDIYLYMRREPGGWTIHALRTLALTGVLAELRRLLRAQPSRSAEEERSLRNAELVLAPDRELIVWALAHRDLLDRVRPQPASPEVSRELEEAGGSGVRIENGRTIVSLGGILDNEVGFLFAPDGQPPPIDPDSHIWVEPVGEGWYLFKTT
ncbi:MAG TPA: hypothetical protein VF605_04315 [Allosphingosinicella sp.]